jgi:hypothetical protein
MNWFATVRRQFRSRDAASVLFLVMLAVSARSSAQTKSDQKPTAISRNQRVTIEFESFDKERGSVKLRLRNRTDWAIRIPVEMNFPGQAIGVEIVKSAKTHPDGAEAPVRYYLEEHDLSPLMQTIDAFGRKSPLDEPKDPPVPKFRRVDFMTEWWIPTNHSLVFEVPKEHLARNVELYVYLRYE